MPKGKHKAVRFTAHEMASDIAAELDFSKIKPVGRGPRAIEVAMRRRVVPLDPDVAKVFGSAKDVNAALRNLIRLAKQSARTGTRASPSRRTA